MKNDHKKDQSQILKNSHKKNIDDNRNVIITTNYTENKRNNKLHSLKIYITSIQLPNINIDTIFSVINQFQ